MSGEETGYGFARYDQTIYRASLVLAWEVFRDYLALRLAAMNRGDWELPALGRVAAPAAVLIRPDGYVAWVGDGTDTGLSDALTTWFGSP